MCSPIAGRVIRKKSTLFYSAQEHCEAAAQWLVSPALYSPTHKDAHLQSKPHEPKVLLEEPHRRQHFKLVTTFRCAQWPFTCTPGTSKGSSRASWCPLHFAWFGSNFTAAQLSFETLPWLGCWGMKSARPQGSIELKGTILAPLPAGGQLAI